MTRASPAGVTAIVIDRRNVASGVTRGGAPGTRDTALLEPEMTVTSIDAVLLGGGSLFGLDAAGGAVGYLRQQGRGLEARRRQHPRGGTGHHLRPQQRRRQGLGPHAPLLGARLAGDGNRIRRALRARYRRRRLRRHHCNLQGRARLDQRHHGIGLQGRRHRRRQRHRLHGGRQGTALLGRAVGGRDASSAASGSPPRYLRTPSSCT